MTNHEKLMCCAISFVRDRGQSLKDALLRLYQDGATFAPNQPEMEDLENWLNQEVDEQRQTTQLISRVVYLAFTDWVVKTLERLTPSL